MGTNSTSVPALILALANGLPPIMLLHEMDQKGRMLNAAFFTSTSCVLGDHLVFTTQTAPELCVPVMLGKAVGGGAALAIALLMAPKLLRKDTASMFGTIPGGNAWEVLKRNEQIN